jgi:hypothetical protein
MPIDPLVKFAKEAIAAKAAEKASVLGGAIGGNEVIEPANINRGVRQRFQGGVVYFTLERGAHEIHGEIGAKYERLGPTWSAHRYPVSDEKGAHEGSATSSTVRSTGILGRDPWLSMRCSCQPIRLLHWKPMLSGSPPETPAP